jgi:transcriptional regulator with XRE-family HTH domain
MSSDVVTSQRLVPADTFAGRLMLSRLHAGNLTIQEAAQRCGLVDQSWSNWEHGRLPRDRVEIVEAISEGLNVDRDWLMYGGPLAIASPRRRKLRTTAYALTRVIDRDRPQTPGMRPSTYGAKVRPSETRQGAFTRRRGAAN